MRQKRIVVIGGGTGVYTVLSGLKNSGHHLSAIVTMADDGGSTGVLREEFGILPPGDVRRALVALSHAEETLAELFHYRFSSGSGLCGHSFGNLFLLALERMTGSFEQAINEAGRLLDIRGEVIPVTLDKVRLEARLKNGTLIRGEHAIDVPKKPNRSPIASIHLRPRPRPNSRALRAIRHADLIVLGPGDLYTSLLPNLIVPGIARALRSSRAKKAYVVNRMTKRGETDGFTAKDFVDVLQVVLGKGVLDVIMVNSTKPSPRLASLYRRRDGAKPVAWTKEMFRGSSFRVVAKPFLRKEGRFIRHDPQKLGRALLGVL